MKLSKLTLPLFVALFAWNCKADMDTHALLNCTDNSKLGILSISVSEDRTLPPGSPVMILIESVSDGQLYSQASYGQWLSRQLPLPVLNDQEYELRLGDSSWGIYNVNDSLELYSISCSEATNP